MALVVGWAYGERVVGEPLRNAAALELPTADYAVFGSGPLAVRGLIEEVHDLAERIAGLVGLDEVAVVLWAWLRLPVALFLLAAVLSVVYRFAPDVD